MRSAGLATTEKIILADDDIRYTKIDLERMSELLEQFEVVRPQNYLSSRWIGRSANDFFVRKRRTSDGAQSFIADDEFILNVEALTNGQKGLLFTGFRALSVTDVQRRGIIVAVC